MRVIRHLAGTGARLPRVVLTLGNFDGVHRGHQAIVARAKALAADVGGQVVVLTFHPHPIAVLAPDRAPSQVQSLRDRLACLAEHGADVVVAQRFTRAFASLDPEAFVTRVLLASLDLVQVVAGYDLTFGHARAGTPETLAVLGQRHGFTVEAVGPVTVDGVTVSSSVIRRAIAAGDVALAAQLLGRPHRVRGRVVGGERRGRQLGFPTANLHLKPRVGPPADGVYAGRTLVDGRPLPAVVNVGMRPTFGELRRTIEAHVLDWQGDLYGRWLDVDLVARLRGEQRFAGVDALRAAIAADVARARTLLAAGT
jgi:riboflavin kinase / FMN adenylyltransferase